MKVLRINAVNAFDSIGLDEIIKQIANEDLYEKAKKVFERMP